MIDVDLQRMEQLEQKYGVELYVEQFVIAKQLNIICSKYWLLKNGQKVMALGYNLDSVEKTLESGVWRNEYTNF